MKNFSLGMLTVLFLGLSNLAVAQQMTGTAVIQAPYYNSLVFPEHVQKASRHSMTAEQSLLPDSTVTIAQGESSVLDYFKPATPTPLGDVARELRKEHAAAPKAVFILRQ